MNMKNFVAVVVLMGLVIVHGSSLFELENYNGLDNEGSYAQAVSTNIIKLTGDTRDLKRNNNRDAIGTRTIRDKVKRDFWETLASPILGLAVAATEIQLNVSLGPFYEGTSIGQMSDFYVAVYKETRDKVIPEIVSIAKQLAGLVHCQDYICTINVLGLNITAGYDSVNIGLLLYIDFMGYTVVNEKISTTGFRYCEPVELPIKKVKICIEVSNMELNDERGCLDLAFSILGYSHAFLDLCVFGSRMRN